jgi:hypothetical protein
VLRIKAKTHFKSISKQRANVELRKLGTCGRLRENEGKLSLQFSENKNGVKYLMNRICFIVLFTVQQYQG